MTEHKCNYKRKFLSIPLFDDEGNILFDCILVYNNLDIDSIQIYDKLRFGSKYVVGFPICYSFIENCEKCIRSRIVELLQKNPNLSSTELTKITGYSPATISRHYMILKRKINKGDKL